MKKMMIAIAAGSLALGAAAQAQGPGDGPRRGDGPNRGEAQLARMLEGRTAGRPVACIPAQVSERLKIIDRTAVVYDGGRTIYVAKPRDPRTLDTNDILVINRFGSQLCKTDVVRTVDRSSGFMTGVVFLGDFVPYTSKRR
jgi:hypothetical protein